MDISQERAVKHGRVAEYLDSHGLEAVLLSRRCNFSWYTCGARNYVGTACDAGNSFLLVRRDGAAVVANNIEATRLRQEDLPADVELIEFPYYESGGQASALRKALGSAKAAADAPAGVELPPLGGDFERLRWSLTESEVERYRALCDDAVGAVEFIACDARPGVTEHELAGMLAGALMCTGAVPWTILVAADERIVKFRHPLPSDLVMQRRFMLVVCAERGGLISACSRLVSLEPISRELSDRMHAAATVDAALIASTRVGATLGDIFAVAQEAYAAVGFADQWRLHHQGGSIGYLPREAKAAPGDRTPVLANQAFAWNPSITGAKSEDTILCRPDGPELLAGSTGWPAIRAEWKGQAFDRPAILVR